MNVGRVVLASKSPQRLQIVKSELGYANAEAVKSGFAEDLDKDMFAPFEYCMQTAIQKALDVYRAEANADEEPGLLIAADTVIELNGITLEKPKGADDHIEMLKKLRDNKAPHSVYTGVAVIVPFEKPVMPGYALETCLGHSLVDFRSDATDEEIIEYVKSGEASDAAGGYKLQGKGEKFLKVVKGDKFNVIGLPVEDTKKLIAKTIEQAAIDEDELHDYSDESNSEG